MLPDGRHGEARPIDLARGVAVERPGLAHAIQQNAPSARHAASSTHGRPAKRVQARLRGLGGGEGEEGVRVERAREEVLVAVLRRHRQQPVRPRSLRRAGAVHHQRGRQVGRLLARVLLHGGEELEVLELVGGEAGLRGRAERGEVVGLVHRPDAPEVVLAEGVADHRVERAVRVRRGRRGQDGARPALVDEQVLQLGVRQRRYAHVVGQRPAPGVVHLQVVHLHHGLVDVHQLLQLELLARVRQLAQLPTLLEVGFQLDQPLHDLAVRLVLLAEAVVLVLQISAPRRSYLAARTKHQVGVGVVHVCQRPVAPEKRLSQLFPLSPPVVQNVLANLVRIHATELQLLKKQRLQNVLAQKTTTAAYHSRLRLVLSRILVCTIEHSLEQVQRKLLGLRRLLAVELVSPQP